MNGLPGVAAALEVMDTEPWKPAFIWFYRSTGAKDELLMGSRSESMNVSL